MGAAIYLDHHATTPLDPRVREAMAPYLGPHFGNPASRSHRFGWVAEEAVERAREQVAAAIGAAPSEIVWTSGATESNNLALLGLMRANGLTRFERRLLEQSDADLPPRLTDRRGRALRDHLLTLATEHKAVLDPAAALLREGYRVTVLDVGTDGLVDLGRLVGALETETLLVSVMMANNEIGVLQPVAEIGAELHLRGVYFHVDAAQALGRVPIDVAAQGIDLLSVSGHKIYGPKGVGALYLRRRSPRVTLEPLGFGGGQERGLRSGTLNVAGIVGLGAAAELAVQEMAAEQTRLAGLRDRLWAALESELDGLRMNGHPKLRLAGNLNLSFEGIEGEPLMLALGDVALSSGSACTSETKAPSHVLRAIGLTDEEAHGALRFGLGRFTTEAEIDRVALRIIEKVRALRRPTFARSAEQADWAAS